MSKGDIDWLGPHGGELGLAFAGGCVAAFVFLAGIGRWLWGVIDKARGGELAAKDAEIARLREQNDHDSDRCAQMETRLVQRIQQLEGFILAMAPHGGALRQEIQLAISEQRVEAAEK